MVDLLIKNGRIFDPGQKLDIVGDIAVYKGKIAEIAPVLTCDSRKTVDAKGFFVVPGLIDVHTHINWKGNYIGMPADLGLIPGGVTATIDAGSTGVSNFRSLLRYLDTCEIKAKLMLHVSAGGQMMSKQYAENIDPAVWDRDLFERAFEDYGKRIAGLKLRVSTDVVGSLELIPLKRAVELADHLHTRVFVHPTDPPKTMEEVVSVLRPGDVLCHMYHNEGHTIMERGEVTEEIWKAKERGVVFDVSQGRGNFSIRLAEKCIRQGFIPDTISTDLNIENWNAPWDFSLLMTMSKFMALGMSFSDVIRCTTSNAAAVYGEPDGMGTLKTDTDADISILSIEEKKIPFTDKYGDRIIGKQVIKPMVTIIKGNIFYCSCDVLAER